MTQKIIKVGNSIAVVIPKEYAVKTGFKAGDEVKVEMDETVKSVYIRPKNCVDTGLTPEFKNWLDKVSLKQKDVIQTLAKS